MRSGDRLDDDDDDDADGDDDVDDDADAFDDDYAEMILMSMKEMLVRW